MDEPAAVTPRWGNEGRDRKAMAILRTIVSECGGRVTDGTWLDIGCGSGGIASTIAPHVGQIIGIDPESWPSWAALAGSQPNLSFVSSGFDGEQLPMPEAMADVVICNQVYEHVAHPEVLIHNIYRVLKPGGICYFAGPNLLWPIEPHVHWPVVHWLPRRAAHRAMVALGSRRAAELDAWSTHFGQLRRWFSGAGFIWMDAVPARVAVELAIRGNTRLGALVERVPKSAWKTLVPLWPGFVFILCKPAGGRCVE